MNAKFPRILTFVIAIAIAILVGQALFTRVYAEAQPQGDPCGCVHVVPICNADGTTSYEVVIDNGIALRHTTSGDPLRGKLSEGQSASGSVTFYFEHSASNTKSWSVTAGHCTPPATPTVPEPGVTPQASITPEKPPVQQTPQETPQATPTASPLDPHVSLEPQHCSPKNNIARDDYYIIPHIDRVLDGSWSATLTIGGDVVPFNGMDQKTIVSWSKYAGQKAEIFIDWGTGLKASITIPANISCEDPTPVPSPTKASTATPMPAFGSAAAPDKGAGSLPILVQLAIGVAGLVCFSFRKQLIAAFSRSRSR